MKKILFLLAFATIGFTFQAAAQKTVNRNIQIVTINKNVKINNGIQSGSINCREAVALKAQNRKLNRTMYNAVSDNRITRREATNITRINKNLNRNIRIAKRS